MAPPVAGIKLNANGVPDFDDLPLRKGDPRRSAWGLYGPDDELGTLNRLTDERVAAAARSEIKTGVRISLNWELGAQTETKPFFTRAAFHQELVTWPGLECNDDVWTFNTQVSSQWDGLRHYAYQAERRFYNGVTNAQIHAVGEDGKPASVLGVHAWSQHGIVGRGVLVDYHAWRQAQPNPPAYDPFALDTIKLADLKACLAAQGTELRFGDILIIRSGWTVENAKKTPAQLAAYQAREGGPAFGGVEQTEEVLRWVWDNFSAVAGDAVAFECWPHFQVKEAPFGLHEVFLAGWGCPIGEMFDLEALSAHCKREGRYSFFVASEPCNVRGGVASPPNILAIF